MRPLAVLLPFLLAASAYMPNAHAGDPTILKLKRFTGKVAEAIKESTDDEDERRIERAIYDLEKVRTFGYEPMLPQEEIARASQDAFGKILTTIVVNEVPVVRKLAAWGERQAEHAEKYVMYETDLFNLKPSFNIFSIIGAEMEFKLPHCNIDVRAGYDYSRGYAVTVSGVWRLEF